MPRSMLLRILLPCTHRAVPFAIHLIGLTELGTYRSQKLKLWVLAYGVELLLLGDVYISPS